MPKRLCLLEKGVSFGYLPGYFDQGRQSHLSWLQLVYFRKPKLFTWNVYIDQTKKCQHRFPLVLTVGQAGLRKVAFLEVGPPHTNVSVVRQ